MKLANSMHKTIRPALGLLVWLGCAASVHADVLLEETFDYPNGRLVDVSHSAWTSHSGSLSLDVLGAQALLGQSDLQSGREDVNHPLSQTFNPLSDNITRVYAGFTVCFSTLPVGSDTYTAGSFFAHLMSSNPGEYYARIGANTEGAAPGFFRLAIANESWTSSSSVEYPLDLSLGVTYTVAVRLDLATDQSTLWINPSSENSQSVTATDALTYAQGGVINSFALRQGTSDAVFLGFGAPGELLFDNLYVATQFSELLVIPEPSAWVLLTLGLSAIYWPRRVSRD